jgi:glycosyltransferase involved in cell wall biosynthesis
MTGKTVKFTIVIPTHGRPQYLNVAIDSALADIGDEVEVIVVPNGPDRSWKEVASHYARDERVRFEPISEAGANFARNHGMRLARGCYIRFLDDDDYLYPPAALEQYRMMEDLEIDVVSGDIDVIDDSSGERIRTIRQPMEADFCAATLGPDRNTLPLAHVYRVDAIKSVAWREQTPVRQDTEWQLDLCASFELRWKKTNCAVGVWRQHWGSRISRSSRFNEIRRIHALMIQRTIAALSSSDRLTPTRRKAAASALWALVHSCFFLSPKEWTATARLAMALDKQSRPRSAIFRAPVLRHLNPLLIEWLLAPKRAVFHGARMGLRRLRIRHSW